ncbi:unnamed protein product [Rotaria socialis]|nr:unnamed protein product [Rotaria socialis]
MNQYRQEELKKKSDKKMNMLGLTSDLSALLKKKSKSGHASTTLNDVNADECYKKDQNAKIINKVNIEYLNTLLPHLKHYNAYCGMCICTRYFGKNISQPTALLHRCTLKCSGHVCHFKCKVHVLNNGYCFVIAINRKICHRVNEKIGRPIRGSQRRAIMDKFKAGGSVYRVHAQYEEKRTIHEKKGFNYDATGKSKKVFKKIKAEANAESLLSPDISLGILQLHDKLAQEMNSDGIIKGALQIVQFRPFCVVAFTEASIRLYDSIVNRPESVLSWDATGGIVKNSSSKQCLYYELTITHPNIVDEDSLVPLTFMLSESQTLFTVKQWLSAFKECYRKVFPHKKDSFPRPAIILSDRAQVFLQAALYGLNDENYSAFLARAYRIVTNAAIRNDLSKTNIHACLSHFMLDMRKRVNKYLPEDVREIAMWAIALLVNTSTWREIKDNWRLICQVFFNYASNDNINFKQHHATLLSRISNITNDPNSSRAIHQSKEIRTNINDPFAFDDDNELDDYDHNTMNTNENIKTNNKRKRSTTSHLNSSNINKSIIDEEEELNKADSPFKQELQAIYNECLTTCIKNNGAFSSSDKASKGTRQWLSYINQRCIPTIPIWSNILLGNLSRHGASTVRAFDNLLLSTHNQRTNAISERRMSIVKRTQLGIQTRCRSDVILEILVNDMKKMVEKFSISLMATMFQDTDNETNSQQLKNVQERWRQSNRRGHGHYAKTPETSIMNNLKNSLIISSSNINDALLIPHLSVAYWLNISIGLLLSIKFVRETYRPTLMKTPLLVDILSFINNWISGCNRLKPPKKTSTELNKLLNTQFNITVNVPIDTSEQLSFIIHNILLPIISYSISVKKNYRCTSCKHTVNTRFNISYIEISMVENQFRFNQQLANYFANNASDHICDKCSMLMSRQIKISDCPPVIILKVNDIKNSTNLSSKPPPAVCFYPFLDDSYIGCASSSVYDIVAFLSVVSDVNNKLVLATKIKQRWKISGMNTLIGNGEKLAKLFANSRLIILERIRTSNTNFLYAIAKCCSIIIDFDENNYGSCKTLHHAVQIIENNEKFNTLRQILTSNLTTSYQCQKCYCSSNSLSSTSKSIYIYQSQTKSPHIYATPLIWEGSLDLNCSICNERTENITLPITHQVHHQCPSFIMYHLSRTTFNSVMNLHVELTDYKQKKHLYKPSTVLLIDEYNSISVIQLDEVLVFPSCPYTKATSYTNDEINELFDTSRTSVLATNTNNIDENNASLLCTPKISISQQAIAVSTSTSIQFNQPIPVRVLNKCTNKLIVGSIRSLKIVPQ